MPHNFNALLFKMLPSIWRFTWWIKTTFFNLRIMNAYVNLNEIGYYRILTFTIPYVTFKSPVRWLYSLLQVLSVVETPYIDLWLMDYYCRTTFRLLSLITSTQVQPKFYLTYYVSSAFKFEKLYSAIYRSYGALLRAVSPPTSNHRHCFQPALQSSHHQPNVRRSIHLLLTFVSQGASRFTSN